MVNFGSPRVGNAAFCDAYNALVPDSVRMVNGSDAVPTVPALLGYRHVQHGVRVTASGAVAREEPPVLPAEGAAAGVPGGAVIAGVAQLAAKALGDGNGGGQGTTKVAAEVAVALASLVDAAAHEAHFEEQYLSALRAAIGSSPWRRRRQKAAREGKVRQVGWRALLMPPAAAILTRANISVRVLYVCYTHHARGASASTHALQHNSA
jgi:hypothetical protein